MGEETVENLSRRGLLAAGVAAGVPLGQTGVAAASGGGEPDAIVIGAGYAGVTAARELAARGLRPLVLEARDRIGGRTWTDTFAGLPVERGGTWVHWSQPHVWAEMMRYGIGVVEDPAPDRAILPTPDGPRSFPLDEAFGHLGELLVRFFDGAATLFDRPFDPLYNADAVRPADRISLRARLDAMRLPARDESWMSGVTSAYSGGRSTRGAYTQMARWWSLAGGGFDKWNAATGHYRIESGTIGLLTAILADASAELRLSTPVASVVDDGRRVHVTTRSGRRFSAPVAVVALPANVWHTIRFDPGLPAAHTAATREGIGVPNGTKIWIHVRGDVGRFFAQDAEGGPISALIPYRETGDGLLVVGFSYHPTFDGSDLAQVRAAVRRQEPKAEVTAIKAQNWARDEFSLGGAACQTPGQLTRLHAALQRPSGRLAFATSDIAAGWNGYIDGAIESGIRAGRQAADAAGR
ncbi:flavin monoamine oxidase family protein [Herbidospora mongoliensis]|uniref:flavin monoamine oxidase family protein n=1 Tax=Herbidospora mongoliensis TaxID=688067 RepID=UPI000A012FB2|nr:NAD(P)/FAD-dependent oxidoreductase [Herbidospora mongoliensis]